MERIKTGIEHFDRALNGGIPAGSIVLVAGTTGTMKSTFVYYILNTNKNSGAYITLEQSKNSLETQMGNLGLAQYVKIVDRAELAKELQKISGRTFLDIFSLYLKNLKLELNYKLLAVDSLSALEVVAELQKPRIELFKFFEGLHELGVTTFLITEMSPDSKAYGKYGEEFIADGLLHLKMEEISEVKVQRRIRCVKMRTTLHSTDWFVLFFSDGKLHTTEVISEA
ncbi:MAG: ATPase domain-containing protein [Candidatus Thermoplasmatota archaeon]|nr:ATPase domain-containing protein [Candidatus Thermoplasmatota archaeon]